MRPEVVGWQFALCLAVAAPAQTFAERIESAEALVENGDLRGGTEALLQVVAHAADDDERTRLAAALTRVGDEALEGSAFEPARRAFEGALALQRQRFDGRDAPEVAVALANLAFTLPSLGRPAEALPLFEEVLAMRKRLCGDVDDAEVAIAANNVAACLETLGRARDALSIHESVLAMRRRLYGDGDHSDIAMTWNNLGTCQLAMGRDTQALESFDTALAMRRRLFGSVDHVDLAASLNNVAWTRKTVGRLSEAIDMFEEAVAMLGRLHGGADHPHIATTTSNIGLCLQECGRIAEARVRFETALAMWRRVLGGNDHRDLASTINNLAIVVASSGRPAEALPLYDAVLSMDRRMFGERDHPETAGAIGNLAVCLEQLGRTEDALARHEQSLAMKRRILGDGDHADIARSLLNTANCLRLLGRDAAASPMLDAALQMRRRLYPGDHADIAVSETALAASLAALGRSREAMPHAREAMEMWGRMLPSGDHPDAARAIEEVGQCHLADGRTVDALVACERALAMKLRLYGDADSPNVVSGLVSVGACLEAAGRVDEARSRLLGACEMVERMRTGARLSTEGRQTWFDHLKRSGCFERLQRLSAGAEAAALAERSRGRDLLDLMEQQYFDPVEAAIVRAARRGDDATASRLRALRAELEAASLGCDRVLHELTAPVADATGAERRGALREESKRANETYRRLLDERARLVDDVLRFGRTRSVDEIRATLRTKETLLEFTVTSAVAQVYVFTRDQPVAAIPLPHAHAAVVRWLPDLLGRVSRAQFAARGRDPQPAPAAVADTTPARELFAALIPPKVWDCVAQSERVFIAAHRELHRLPFELLEIAAGETPATWLDRGPPIAYVPSGSMLHWLRNRAADASDDATALDLLAVGDPDAPNLEPEVPEQGVFVLSVDDGGEGARVGLQPGDVLVQYDGRPLADDRSLRDLRTSIDAAIEDGQRPRTPLPVRRWRRGDIAELEVQPGPLGIRVGQGPARAARERTLAGDPGSHSVTRSGDVERLRTLPPLRGARAETEAIARVFEDERRAVKRLSGRDATEPSVFELAARAKYLHFACHGIAEEYAGQSLSMLVLSQPKHVLPGDDGLLKLTDLLQSWPGRLASCRLVVLSACRTNVGPTLRDEAPQALPIGFLFAGAPAVVSSLWAVDDESTRELMADFYGRLVRGESDRLAAFTAAKKALRAKYPDPFHWAPFLWIGSPD